MRRMAIGLVFLSGCAPGMTNIKETYPKVQVETVKTLLGTAVNLRLTSDFQGHAEGKMNKETGQYEFVVDVNSNVSGVLPAYTQWGTQVMLPSQQLDNEWSQIQWNGINQLVRTVTVDFALPLLGQYISAWKDLGEARLARPSVAAQAVSALALANTGQTAINPSFLWNSLGPQLKAMIERMAPNVVPTTQPSP